MKPVVGLLVILSICIPDACNALFNTWPASRVGSQMYKAVLNGCGDRLDAWKDAALNETRGHVFNHNDSYDFQSGIFMRGIWLQAVDKPHVHSTFLTSERGKFDMFFYRSWFREMKRPQQGAIQNISSTIFFKSDKQRSGRVAVRNARDPFLEATGVYNGASGEICIVGCLKMSFNSVPANRGRPFNSSGMVGNDSGNSILPYVSQGDKDCNLRGLFNLTGSLSRKSKLTAKGHIESLRNETDIQYFTSISFSGTMVRNKDQRFLYKMENLMHGTLFVVEAVLVAIQVIYTVKSTAGFFVSTLMVLVQIVMEGFNSVRLVYLPLRLRSFRKFKYLFTAWSFVPWILDVLLVVLNMLFFFAVYRKRRVAKRSNVEGRPQELPLAAICITVYGVVGAALWSIENFETYLQMVKSWFLLPQVVANVFWDLRCKPLHPVYIVGISMSRIVYLAFDSLRPTIYGYDDLDKFPHSWFWGTTSTVLLFMTYALLQQHYGGRSFIPGRWFGYKKLPSSYTQAEAVFEKSDDYTIELGRY